MIYRYVMVWLLLLGSMCQSYQSTLLIFSGLSGEQLTDEDGMNVGHQVLTALAQKVAPALISKDLWNHIISRRQRCQDRLKAGDVLYQQVRDLIDATNNLITQKKPLSEINVKCNVSWFHQNYPALAALSKTDYSGILFDFFCLEFDQLIIGWNMYHADNYVIAIPHKYHASFNLDLLNVLSAEQALQNFSTNQDANLAVFLAKYLKSKNHIWTFYLTGHGHHGHSGRSGSIICGMKVDAFRDFLNVLQNSLKTNLLVYSSCYSSGLHLMEPYQKNGHDIPLNFPVMATCLTDAPVYVFGMPAGKKLPPYNKEIFLEPKDIVSKGLGWYLMQDFSKFVHNAQLLHKYQEIAQSVVVFQECFAQYCTLVKLENVPLIRKPNTTFFVPVDMAYVDCIIHNAKFFKSVMSKHGLLWYIKQYSGTIWLQKKLPQFISMIPGSGVLWAQHVHASEFLLDDIIGKSFFSVEDMHSVQIFMFNMLVAQDCKIHDVMILPKSSWFPKDFVVGELGLCCYRLDNIWFAKTINTGPSIGPVYQLTKQQSEVAKKLWSFLRQEARQQQELQPDILWSAKQFKDRMAMYEQLLRACQDADICRTN